MLNRYIKYKKESPILIKHIRFKIILKRYRDIGI